MGHYECRRCDQRYDKCTCVNAHISKEPELTAAQQRIAERERRVEDRAAEAIATWLDTWIGKLPLGRLASLAADIRAGAWRKKED